MIALYIGNRLIDIEDASLIEMNYTREELGSPATIRNEYSQQVTLPSTANNNLVFDEFFRLDRTTRAGGFNSLQRTPFAIYNETGDILVSGYCKLDKVQYKGTQVYSYSVSLYGALGGYFYDLSYLPDGNPMTLGDLTYQTSEGVDWKPNEQTIQLKANIIYQLWDAIGSHSMFGDEPWYNVLNFAPCYNGIPADFDAKKALVTGGSYKDIVSKSTDDKPHPQSSNTYLVTMATDKTPDEVRDYRAYLQRPVLSVKAFIDALVNRGGLYVTAQARARLEDSLWITLPLPARSSDYAHYQLTGIFGKSMTPADLLISLAKCFGLVFLSMQDTIQMMTRDEFYSGGKEIDLEGRIDKPSIAVKPNGVDAKWYLFADEVTGAFADDYRDKYGRTYAEQKVNTGWDFDSSSKVVTSQKTRGAAQVLGQSRMFVSLYNALGTYFPSIPFEQVSFQGYNSAGTESKTITLEADNPVFSNKIWYNSNLNYYDATDKPQFCDKDGKPADGSGVLLYYNGYKAMPTDSKCWWRLSDDDQTLYDLLNDGKPCYEMRTSGGTMIGNMPMFSRWSEDKNLDWGIASEIGIPAVSVPSGTMYARYWRQHIAELYDRDAMVVSAMVDLRGMQVGQGLLRNLYWFNGSWWKLNRIVNHSLTTNGMTECEFIRRVEVSEQGEDSIELAIYETGVTAEEQTASAFVRASAAWKVQSYPSWCSGFTPQRGEASLSYTEVEFDIEENTGDARTGNIVFGLEDGTAQVTLRIIQAGQVTPPEPTRYISLRLHDTVGTGDNFETIGADDTYIYPWLTSSGAWTITCDQTWITPMSGFSWHGETAVSNEDIWCNVELNTGATRQATLTATLDGTDIKATYIVTQQGGGTAKYLYLSPNGTKNVAADVIRQSISINSNTSWRVDAGNGVTIDGGSSKTGTGNATLEMAFSANTGETQKTNTLSVRTTVGTLISDSLQVIQAGVTPEPPQVKFLTLSQNSISFPQGGGASSIVLASSSAWSIVSVPTWLTISPSSGDTTSGQMLTLTAGEAGAERGYSLVFSNEDGETAVLDIYQAYAPLSVTPSSVEFSAEGESKEIAITCEGDWTISGLPTWVTTDETSGTGDATVTLTASENGSELARVQTIKVNGQGESVNVGLRQEGTVPTETIAWQESSPIIMSRGESVILHIVTNAVSYSLNKTGLVDGGKWTVTKVGNNVTIKKETLDDATLTLIATTPQGTTATMVINSGEADVTFGCSAWRQSVVAKIDGTVSVANDGDASVAISTAVKIEFLDASMVTLYQTTLTAPSFVDAGESWVNTMEIASIQTVNRYGLNNAVYVRMSATIGGRSLSSQQTIRISQTPIPVDE